MKMEPEDPEEELPDINSYGETRMVASSNCSFKEDNTIVQKLMNWLHISDMLGTC